MTPSFPDSEDLLGLQQPRQQIIQDCLDSTLFSWSVQSQVQPLCIERADGVYLYDYDGRRYLDFSSQLMNVNLGHNHPTVKKAIQQQLDQFCYITPDLVSSARGKLGIELQQIAPSNLKKTFFTTGGADAIENAIKMARLYTGRHKIIAKYRSYHGATYGAIAAGGDPRKFPVERDAMTGVVHVEDPYCYRCPWGKKIESCQRECADHVARVVELEGPETIAAILLEGESGSSGCIKYPPGYLEKIKEICQQKGILLIIDEVMSGLGRCGEWFAIQRTNVQPDLLVFAKGITSGYIPLGGVMISQALADFFQDRPLPLGLTYSAHPLACAAALGALAAYREENVLEKARKMGKYLEEKIAEMQIKHPSLGDFRNTGLLGCLELVKDPTTATPLVPWNAPAAQLGPSKQLAKYLRQEGLFTIVRWNYVFIAPPLTITQVEMDEGLAIIERALGWLERELQIG